MKALLLATAAALAIGVAPARALAQEREPLTCQSTQMRRVEMDNLPAMLELPADGPGILSIATILSVPSFSRATITCEIEVTFGGNVTGYPPILVGEFKLTFLQGGTATVSWSSSQFWPRY